MKSLEFFLFYLVSIISLLKVLILWYFSTPPNCNESFLRFSSIQQLVNTTYFIQKQYLLLLKNASLVLWYYSGVYQHHQSNGYTLIYLVHTILFLVIINLWFFIHWFSSSTVLVYCIFLQILLPENKEYFQKCDSNDMSWVTGNSLCLWVFGLTL